jgi:hypothetical protein
VTFLFNCWDCPLRGEGGVDVVQVPGAQFPSSVDGNVSFVINHSPGLQVRIILADPDPAFSLDCGSGSILLVFNANCESATTGLKDHTYPYRTVYAYYRRGEGNPATYFLIAVDVCVGGGGGV